MAYVSKSASWIGSDKMFCIHTIQFFAMRECGLWSATLVRYLFRVWTRREETSTYRWIPPIRFHARNQVVFRGLAKSTHHDVREHLEGEHIGRVGDRTFSGPHLNKENTKYIYILWMVPRSEAPEAPNSQSRHQARHQARHQVGHRYFLLKITISFKQ